jgi:anti-sigma regulatory factor (Ser/Thr protein kinase)
VGCDVEYRLSGGLGGDYYDFIDMEGDRLGIAIADVLGHSVSSAIVMSTCRALLREYCRHELSPAAILRLANDTLERDLPDDMFVTLFLAVLDLRDFRLTYANAGQCYPLHFRAKERDFEVLAVGGLPLGFQRGVDYREAHAELSPDDILVLYTDGVTETRLPSGRQLSVKGLTNVVRRVMMADSPRLARAIYAAIQEESGASGEGGDDVTLIALRVGRELARESFAVPSTEAGVRLAVERAERFARQHGFISDRILQFRLVLTETLTNAFEHGNLRDPEKAIHAILAADRRRMSVRVRDEGPGYDATRVLDQAQDLDLTSSRGRGLTIIRKYVDSVQVTEKGNAITLAFGRGTF